MSWKYTDDTNRVVSRTNTDGSVESCLVTAPEIRAWLAEGNTPEPAEPEPDPKIQESLNYLASTDWYYIRLAETDQPVPQDVVDKRIAARAYLNQE